MNEFSAKDVRAIERIVRENTPSTVEVEGIELTDGVLKRVPHKLGRKVKGYYLSRTTAASAAFALIDELSQNSDTDRFLYLRAVGSDAVINLVVY